MGFSTSLSGLFANQQKLNVIGNNLANINTIAFKASSVHFQDLVSQNVAGASSNPMQVGLGVTTGAITPNFVQGGVESTGVSTHVAIQGRGFFVVGSGINDRSFTRAGDFSFDAAGRLVTSDGLPVQGYTAIDPLTGNIITTGEPSDIIVSPGILREPGATTLFGTVSNLDARASVGDSFTASVQIYDALGQVHVGTITYTNTGPGAWDYDISVPGEDVAGGTAGTPSSIATGTVTFDANGRLAQVNGAAAADVVVTSPAWANGAAATNFTWDLVDANGVGTLTGYATTSATSSITQNGYAAGAINPISIDPDGNLIATIGAGRTIIIATLAMASFNNPQGLYKLGSNRFGETEASGIPNIGVANTGGRGTVFGAALEQSNVDIAQEFTQMILAQRGYQANSRSITVADELLVETLNLKR
jgi:flagellar hook protein FlgE